MTSSDSTATAIVAASADSRGSSTASGMPTSRIVSTAMASISVGRDFMVLSSAPEMRLAWISTPGRSSRVGVARMSTSPRAEVPTMTIAVLELVGAERAPHHVGGRDVAKASLVAVGNERGHPLVERNPHRVADAHEADPSLRSPAGVDDGRLEVDRRVAEVDAKDGQRHRLEEAVPNLHEHGHAARHTVRVEGGLQMSRGDRGRLQRRNVAAVARGAEMAVLRVRESARRERRARQDTRSILLGAY